jgi:hypothetical protein
MPTEDLDFTIKKVFSGLACEILDVVRRYAAIRKTTFRVSIRSVIPIPGVFKATDFDASRAALDALQEEMGRITLSISDLLCKKDLFSTSIDLYYLEAPRDYAQGMKYVISELSKICRRLEEKSIGTNAYSWSEYRRELAALDRLALGWRPPGATIVDMVREFGWTPKL